MWYEVANIKTAYDTQDNICDMNEATSTLI